MIITETRVVVQARGEQEQTIFTFSLKKQKSVN